MCSTQDKKGQSKTKCAVPKIKKVRVKQSTQDKKDQSKTKCAVPKIKKVRVKQSVQYPR